MAVLSEGQGTPHTRRRLLVELFSDWPFFLHTFLSLPSQAHVGANRRLHVSISCHAWLGTSPFLQVP